MRNDTTPNPSENNDAIIQEAFQLIETSQYEAATELFTRLPDDIFYQLNINTQNNKGNTLWTEALLNYSLLHYPETKALNLSLVSKLLTHPTIDVNAAPYPLLILAFYIDDDVFFNTVLSRKDINFKATDIDGKNIFAHFSHSNGRDRQWPRHIDIIAKHFAENKLSFNVIFPVDNYMSLKSPPVGIGYFLKKLGELSNFYQHHYAIARCLQQFKNPATKIKSLLPGIPHYPISDKTEEDHFQLAIHQVIPYLNDDENSLPMRVLRDILRMGKNKVYIDNHFKKWRFTAYRTYKMIDDGLVWSKLIFHHSNISDLPDNFDAHFDPYVSAYFAKSNPQNTPQDQQRLADSIRETGGSFYRLRFEKLITPLVLRMRESVKKSYHPKDGDVNLLALLSKQCLLLCYIFLFYLQKGTNKEQDIENYLDTVQRAYHTNGPLQIHSLNYLKTILNFLKITYHKSSNTNLYYDYLIAFAKPTDQNRIKETVGVTILNLINYYILPDVIAAWDADFPEKSALCLVAITVRRDLENILNNNPFYLNEQRSSVSTNQSPSTEVTTTPPTSTPQKSISDGPDFSKLYPPSAPPFSVPSSTVPSTAPSKAPTPQSSPPRSRSHSTENLYPVIPSDADTHSKTQPSNAIIPLENNGVVGANTEIGIVDPNTETQKQKKTQ